MPKKIIIDTDPGVDDSMAILFALNSPEVELIGLTTVFGNVHVEQAAKNALWLLEFAGRPDIPVAQGAALPLIVPLDSVGDFVHGTDGLGNTNQAPPNGQPLDISAAQFIIETVMANPGEVTLIPIAPMTNIALAVALEPRIVENVAEVVIMGGAAHVEGNSTPAAEANVFHDPHAADVVFTAGWPVTMVGLDVTTKTIMDDAYIASLKAAETPTCNFIYDITRFYRQFHEDYHGETGLYTHDPSAVAYVIDPTLFTVERGPVRIVTEGIAQGKTIIDRRKVRRIEDAWTNQPDINVCIDVDSERLLALYYERITQPASG